MTTIKEAIRAEDPHTPVTTNIETDVAKWAYDAVFAGGFWTEAVTKWAPMLDMLSIDSYPNMATPYPCEANVTADIVRKIRQMVPDKKVFLMEAGYWVVHNASAVPQAEGYTPERQAECALANLNQAIEAGASGMIWFMCKKSSGIMPPPGGFTELDIEALQHVARLQTSGDDPFDILGFLILHADYFVTRFPKVVASWWDGVGIFELDGTPRPAFTALKNRVLGH